MKTAALLLLVLAVFSRAVFGAETRDELMEKAEAGDATAQFVLGFAYEMGSAGKPKDGSEAVRWYRRAAEQGSVASMVNLGWMYAGGNGVPKDYVQAHAWWNIAGAKGAEDGKKNLSMIEKEMTTEQKAEAMKLAREIFERIQANKK